MIRLYIAFENNFRYPKILKRWYLNHKLHREDGPAIEYADGHKEWWLNGKLHREDGPAVEGLDGYKEWWINGNRQYIDK